MPTLTVPVIQPDDSLACGVACSPRLGDVETGHFAAIFRALSHPVRLRMLDLIGQNSGRICSCDIEPHFELTQPTISHHLAVLRDAGLIDAEQRGVYIHYQLNRPLLASVQGILMLLNNGGR
jgi:ArsR family transcriptional regulator